MKEIRELLPNKLKDLYDRNPHFNAVVHQHMQINLYGFTNSAYIRMLEAAIIELDEANVVNKDKLTELLSKKTRL